MVQSEDAPQRLLLETRICKEDGFQKQQGIDIRQVLTLGWADEQLQIPL